MKKELEKAAERLSELQEATYTTQHKVTYKHGFIDGAKWQAERMYSEEEVKQIIDATLIEHSDFVLADIPKWFKQFKKK
jgi:hypothetical protein